MTENTPTITTEQDGFRTERNCLFTLNGDSEDALNVLRGVSCALSMLAVANEECGNHLGAENMFWVLSGAVDASIETLSEGER